MRWELHRVEQARAVSAGAFNSGPILGTSQDSSGGKFRALSYYRAYSVFATLETADFRNR